MTGTNLVSYQDRYAADAERLAAQQQRSAAFISTAGGMFSVGGTPLGERIVVVIVDSFFENNYFNPKYPYEQDNPLTPICFAMARATADLYPHASMQLDPWFVPQNWPEGSNAPAGCASCPQNKWGSSTRGKGKACQNRQRLLVIPAGYYHAAHPRAAPTLTLFDKPDHYAKSDVVALRLPITSGENYAKYVTQLAAAHRRPPAGAITEIYMTRDPKTQYKVNFELIELVPDELAGPILGRVDEQQAQPFVGFTAPTREQIELAEASLARGAAGDQTRYGFDSRQVRR